MTLKFQCYIVDDVSTYLSVCIGEDIPDSGFSPSNPRVLM